MLFLDNIVHTSADFPRDEIWFVATFTYKSAPNIWLERTVDASPRHNGFLSLLFYYEFRSLICICPLFTQGAETKGQLWKHLAVPKGSGLDVMSVLPAWASICSSTTEVSGSCVPAYWGRAPHMASIGQPLHWGMTDAAHADSCWVPHHSLWPAPNIMYIRGAQTGRGLSVCLHSKRNCSKCCSSWSWWIYQMLLTLVFWLAILIAYKTKFNSEVSCWFFMTFLNFMRNDYKFNYKQIW